MHLISRNPHILLRDIDTFAVTGIPIGNVPDGIRVFGRVLRLSRGPDSEAANGVSVNISQY
jgi:hypothetical protein